MHNRSVLFHFASGTAFVTLLLLFRWHHTGSHFYLFLLWNLFLAFIPYSVSHYMSTRFQKGQSGILHQLKWWMLFSIWLLFFPNAPYVITDLLHLSKGHGIHRWYDLALLFCAGATGLWIGYVSLLQMEALWRQKMAFISTRIFVSSVMLLSGFGIYLGRVMRFNSWDVVADPLNLTTVISSRMLMPWQHPQTWGITCLFAMLLWVGYQQAKWLIKENDFLK
jgi:uncharacterized membrane protein